jgi:cysteine dioxygenase
VEINPDFEVIIICWDKNQESPIHNHSSQNCWFGVLEGSMEEVTYDYDQTTGLTERNSNSFKRGDVGWVNSDSGIHKVRSPQHEVGITMHIYSKPIPMCLIYCPVTNTVSVRRMGFFTVKGKKCAEGSSDCYRKLYEQLMTDQQCDSSYKALFQSS